MLYATVTQQVEARDAMLNVQWGTAQPSHPKRTSSSPSVNSAKVNNPVSAFLNGTQKQVSLAVTRNSAKTKQDWRFSPEAVACQG